MCNLCSWLVTERFPSGRPRVMVCPDCGAVAWKRYERAEWQYKVA